MNTLTIKTLDNKKFEIEQQLGNLSKTIQNCFDSKQQVLYLTDIVGQVLTPVIEFCRYHSTGKATLEWDFDFVNNYCSQYDIIAYTTISGSLKKMTTIQSLLTTANLLQIEKLTNACRDYLEKIKVNPELIKKSENKAGLTMLPKEECKDKRNGIYVPYNAKPYFFDYDLENSEFDKILKLKPNKVAAQPIFYLEDKGYMLAVIGHNQTGLSRKMYNRVASKIVGRALGGDCIIVDDNIYFDEKELAKLLNIVGIEN